MGKQIRAKGPNSVIVIYRFIEKKIFLKANNMQYAVGLIKQVESKGGNVRKGRNWLEVNIFNKDSRHYNLGVAAIDLTIDTDSEIEDKLCQFFLATLETQKFECEVTDL